MEDTRRPHQDNIFTDRYQREFIEVGCPLCNQRKIICLPEESIPLCEVCKVEMVLKEVLTEGKY